MSEGIHGVSTGKSAPDGMMERAPVEEICGQLDSIIDGTRQRRITTKSRDLTIRRLAAAMNRGVQAFEQVKSGRRNGIEALRAAQLQGGFGSWLLRLADHSVDWSPEMHALFETDSDAIRPDLEMTMRLAQTADRQKLKRALDIARRRGHIASCDWHSRGGGRGSRWFWTEFRPERDAKGAVITVQALCQDITPPKPGTNPMARQDLLTGLANRAGLSEDLRKLAADAESQIAAICIDLNNLNRINDIYGYEAGDEVLREVAHRLVQHSRDGDLIGRLDSDEFVFVQAGLDQPASALSLAEHLLQALAVPFILPDKAKERLTASIGIAFLPDHANTPDALLLRAAYALGQAKQSGRNSYTIYNAEMERDQRVRHRLEQDLRIALQKREFSLVYQPLFTAQSRGITGFEALLRWTSLEHGVVPPDVFIPIAERTGLMSEIGEWVIREACREAVRWIVPLRIAVNVSPAQIHRDGLADKIETILRETGLSPDRLEIEITETLLLKDTRSTIGTLQRIRDLGVQIAIDDFGTGYSSLATLRAFPFDKLKVDRSFIRDLGQTEDALAIVKAILGLSRGLHLPVVAEGVETETQAEILKSCGCDQLQGYLLGYPMPIENFVELVGTPAPMVPVAQRSDTASVT
jgi:diguanylate cyclase (GGDEF)-like protein